MYYPPVWNLLVILCASKEEQRAHDAAALLVAQIDETKELRRDRVFPIGPADAAIAKVSDVYKKVVYIKAEKYQALVGLKDMLEEYMRDNRSFSDVIVQFDFNPAGSF